MDACGAVTDVRLIGVDVGGTFTDFVLWEDGALRVHKRPSTPSSPASAILDGIALLDPDADARVAHGTTVATNALLERRGARTAFVTTEGFADLLYLGRGEREELYALQPRPIEPLVAREHTVEARERIGAGGAVVSGLDPEEPERVARAVAALGVESVAVCLLFSFAAPDHERAIGRALAGLPEAHFLSLSVDVLPEMREFERASTTVVNAFLGPIMDGYLARLVAGVAPRPLWVMGSHGGTLPPREAARLPVATLLSGPAAGVAGALALARRAGLETVLTFDMGGTSTDVALCEGHVPMASDGVIDGHRIHVPAVDVQTIGAGGGSIAYVDDAGALRVGPRSAGAVPGPACFQRGGTEPTVTDAHVVLGRIPHGEILPGGLRIDRLAAEEACATIAAALNRDVRDTARAIVQVAEARMERALRRVSVERGVDPAAAALVAFGGAGGLHACALADALGVQSILVPARPGTLSALGLLLCAPATTASRTVLGTRAADASDEPARRRAWREVVDQAVAGLREVGVTGEPRIVREADLRYAGQSFELTIPWLGAGPDAFAEAIELFERSHERRYGYRLDGTAVELVTLRARAELEAPLSKPPPPVARVTQATRAHDAGSAPVVQADATEQSTVILAADSLSDAVLHGPAILAHGDATTWLAPGWCARRIEGGDLMLSKTGSDVALKAGQSL